MIIDKCQCGCGSILPTPKRIRGDRPTQFLRGHFWRGRTRDTTWNTGRTYVIAKRSVYANKGSWQLALRRLYGNACQRCGWDLAPCDAHHVLPKSEGGPFTLENGIILCPNCHRLAHTVPAVQQELPALKATAVASCPSY